MADADAVLHNIDYFVGEVMSFATFDEDWTVEELRKAWTWAKYCHSFSLQQKQLGLLNKCIQVLARRDPQLDVGYVTEVLQDPLSTFTKTILENRRLNETVFQEVVKLNVELELENKFQNVGLCDTVVELNTCALLLRIGGELPSDFLAKLQKHVCSKQVLEVLKRKHGKQILEDIVKQSCQSQEPLNLLVDVLISLAKAEDVDRRCQIFLIDQLHYIFSSKTHSRVLLLTFFRSYTDLVVSECERLYQRNSSCELSSLLKYWTSLLKVSQPVFISIKDLLQQLVSESPHPVWKEIWQALQLESLRHY